jgi:hypothetical protein
MYKQQLVGQALPEPSRPLRMPFDILLALAPNQVPGTLEAFNVLAACNTVLGGFGWERATRVLNPKVWAPDWDEARLASLVAQAGLDPELASDLRVQSFLGLDEPGEPSATEPPQFEIVHFVGEVFNEGSEATPVLVIGEGPAAVVVRPGALRDALVAAGSRLLILQVGLTSHKAELLADFVAGGGGPAVLVLSGRHSERLQQYLVGFYAGLVHNHPLPEIAPPPPHTDEDLNVTLVSDPVRDSALLFTGFLNALRTELQVLTADIESRAIRMRSEQQERSGYLHRHQRARIEGVVRQMDATVTEIREDIDRLAQLEGEIWSHESTGVIPLSELTARAEAVRAAQGLYPALEAEAEESPTRAPRVLNANFADPKTREVVEPDAALLGGRAYDLLVDIGPRWNTVPSIVQGNAEFPEQALPPTEEGTVLKVMLVSSDFEPRTITAELWLPSPSGRSHPIIDGMREERAGPVALRVTAPKLPTGTDRRRAEARVCIYYGHNLLQSAVISAAISRTAATAEDPNRVEIDFALSGTLHDVEQRFSVRDIRFPGEPDTVQHPVALNLALNDDGAGNHRLIVSGDDDLPAGWTAYDPAGASETLKGLRKELLNCFLKRGKTGEPQPDLALDSRNGKDFEQFRRDLFVLARLGERLYSEVLIASWSEDSGMTPKQWERELRSRLSQSRVIQIARTGAAQYTYPWALMYEYPLPGTARDLRWCDVLRQWTDKGIRNGLPETRCPHADDEGHQENIVCPYGFWGLKHIIEQPLSVLDRQTGVPRDVATEIPVDGEVLLAAGWTSDRELDAQGLDTHRQQLLSVPGIRFSDPQPNPACDVTGVRAVLASPSVVYFLCHGEYDSVRKEPYLGIGPRDQSAEHRLYPSTIASLTRSPTPPNLDAWETSRPLVFLNGCHTADLQPGDVLNFVSAFGLARASGVIGTEVSVRLGLATEIAEDLLERLARGERAGRALYDMRWKLVNKGNLLGLVYTLYAMADLHVAGVRP